MAGEIKLQINGFESCGDGAPEVRGVLRQALDILEILKGVEYAVTEERGLYGESIDWHITDAAKNSPFVLELTPRPRENSTDIDRITPLVVRATMEGIRFLMEVGDLPPYFSGDMVEKTRRIFRRVMNGLDATVMNAPGYADTPRISITGKSARFAISNQKRLKTKELVYRRELGSVEGHISKIQREKDGRLIVWLTSRIDGKIIKCVGEASAFDGIGENMVAEVAQGLRVLVLGILKYEKPRKIGVVETYEIRVFKKNEELPDICDFVDPDFTGGLEASEYLRRIRDNG